MDYLVLLQNLGGAVTGTGGKGCRKPRRAGSQWATMFLNKAIGLSSPL